MDNIANSILCRKIFLDFIGLQMALQLGNTKVFLRAGQMAELDAHRALSLGSRARVIQSDCRRYMARKRFVAQRRASIRVQASWRGKFDDNEAFPDYGANFRNYFKCRWKLYCVLSCSVIHLHDVTTGRMARIAFRNMKRESAAIKIQKYARRRLARKDYSRLRHAAIVLQAAFRVIGAQCARRFRIENKGAILIQVFPCSFLLIWKYFCIVLL